MAAKSVHPDNFYEELTAMAVDAPSDARPYYIAQRDIMQALHQILPPPESKKELADNIQTTCKMFALIIVSFFGANIEPERISQFGSDVSLTIWTYLKDFYDEIKKELDENEANRT